MNGYSDETFSRPPSPPELSPAWPRRSSPRSAPRLDKVTLGKSGLKVTRLAFGTGSNNGHVQYSLGQEKFTGSSAYAYERGIRFFETAEAYMTPAMLGKALKAYPARQLHADEQGHH